MPLLFWSLVCISCSYTAPSAARGILNQDCSKLDPNSVYPEDWWIEKERGEQDGATFLHTFLKVEKWAEIKAVIEEVSTSKPEALSMKNKYIPP